MKPCNTNTPYGPLGTRRTHSKNSWPCCNPSPLNYSWTYEAFPARENFRNSIKNPLKHPSLLTTSNTLTSKTSEEEEKCVKIRPIPPGATRPSADTRIIWKHPSLQQAYNNSKKWRRRKQLPICAPKPCGGAATAQWFPITSRCAAGK